MKRTVLLEPEAEIICSKSARCPRIYQLPPKEGRIVLEELQSSPLTMYAVRIDKLSVNTGVWGTIPVYLVWPEEKREEANVILYLHGAGWVFGSFHTHEKLVRELAARTGCVIVFPEYSRAPEARYPIAIEQCYQILCRLPELLGRFDQNMITDTLTIAGDSAGGNLAIAQALLAKFRKGPRIQKMLLYYPVTNASFDTGSYCCFAENYYLYRKGMMWFWNQYLPSRDERMEIFASPLRAGVEQLHNMPETMILNGQADVLRDEGELFAEKLRCAGVPVTALRFQAIIHDFVMLNELDQTHACRAAMNISVEWIRQKNNIV
ncbi:MAG: alpha/beta hydrolase [Eubacteriales bacterium]|nr:alpha/beta hydrolase [Eubacteriales bacterium]